MIEPQREIEQDLQEGDDDANQKTGEKYLSESRTDRSSGVQTVTTTTKQNDGGGNSARPSERERRMLGWRPKWQKRCE
jgi:hypothetical protein